MHIADATRSPSRLPPPLTPLIGRNVEVREIAELLATARLLTLTGPGGIGKSRLALAVADTISPRFPDGVVRVALAPVRDPALVGVTIMDALDLKNSDGRAPLEVLSASLATRRTLLLLDNFEQVLDAALLVADLLSACEALTVLVTSRVPLHVYGEQLYPVPPLGLPDVRDTTAPECLLQSDSIALFERRARQQQPEFRITPENAAAVAGICRRLDGLPLAIELAAARITVLAPRQLLERLQHRLPLLTGGAQNLPAHQRTMRDTIAWSYDLLHPDDQQLFRQLSVFIGGWTLEAAEAVCDDNMDVLNGHQRLVDHSLIRQLEWDGGQPRFGMLETLREFGLDKLEESGSANETRQRHATFFSEFGQRGAHNMYWRPNGPASDLWHARFETEHDNLRAMLSWADETGNTALGLRLISDLWVFWPEQAYYTEGRAWTDRFLPKDSDVEDRVRARVLVLSGVAAVWQGDSDGGIPRLYEGFQRTLDVGTDEDITIAYHSLGIAEALRADSNYQRAEECFQESLRRARALGMRRGIIHGLNNLAVLAYARGETDRATMLWKEAIEEARTTGDTIFLTGHLGGLAMIAQEQGRTEEAQRYFREALDLESLGWRKRESVSLIGDLGYVLVLQGRTEDGMRLLAMAETYRQRIGEVDIPESQVKYDTARETARARLGENVYAQLWDEGAAMSLEEVIDYARSLLRPDTGGEPIAADSGTGTSAPAGLSKRELEVVKLLAEGRSNAEIAGTLFISPHTVAHHVTSILNKLGVESRTAAVAWAVKNGLD